MGASRGSVLIGNELRTDLMQIVDQDKIRTKNKMIGDIVAPVFSTDSAKGSFDQINIGQDTKLFTGNRGELGGYERIRMDISNDDWETKDGGLEFEYDEIKSFDLKKIMNIESFGTKVLVGANTARREWELSSQVNDTSKYGTNKADGSGTLTTNTNLIELFEGAIQTYFNDNFDVDLEDLSVQMPLDAIKAFVKIEDLRSNSVYKLGDIGVAPLQDKINILQSYLGIGEIIPSRSRYNAGAYKKAAAFQGLWDTNKMNIFVKSTAGRTEQDYSFARRVVYNGPLGGREWAMEDYRERNIKKEVIRILFDDGLKLRHELGFNVDNILEA